MHPRTVATLDELEKADWFASVGTKDTEAAVVLSSWEEAVEHWSSIDWENLTLEASNQHFSRIRERSKERSNQWNEIVEEVRPAAASFVRQKVNDVMIQFSLPKVFEDTVRWDILHLCMEAEYADVCPPGFFASQAFWYKRGRFPCGRDGDFPNGKLIIY